MGPSTSGPAAGIAIVVAALLVALATIGAVEAELTSDFRADGGARHGFELTIDKLTLGLLQGATGGGLGALTELEGPQATAEAAGLDFERIDTDELLGARVTREIDDSSDIGATFADILRSLLPGADGIPEGLVSGTFVEQDGEYRLDLTIDADAVFGGITGGDGGVPSQLGSFVSFTYVASFPGEVIETNGTKVGDDQVRWELPFEGQATLTAVATNDGGGGPSLPLVIGGVVVVAVVAAAGGYALLRRRHVTG